jgi:pantothenate kinase
MVAPHGHAADGMNHAANGMISDGWMDHAADGMISDGWVKYKEPDMQSTIDNPVDHLQTLMANRPGRIMMGIAGPPGSGKSTLAQQLANRMNRAHGDETAVALGMDGFHLSKAQLRQMPDPDLAFARRGAPWTFDAAGFVARLNQLRRADGVVRWPDFAHEVGDPIEDAIAVSPRVRLVLVEGLYLLHDGDGWQDAQSVFDEVWYLNTPFDVAMERLTHRHMRAWSFSRAQAEHRIAQSDGLNAELVRQSQVRANYLIDSLPDMLL